MCMNTLVNIFLRTKGKRPGPKSDEKCGVKLLKSARNLAGADSKYIFTPDRTSGRSNDRPGDRYIHNATNISQTVILA